MEVSVVAAMASGGGLHAIGQTVLEVNTTPPLKLGPQMQVALGPRPPLELAFRGASLQIARRPRPDGPHAEALA